MRINLEIILLWIFWMAIFSGLGSLFFYLLELSVYGRSKREVIPRNIDFFDYFWVGWAVGLFALEIAHFWVAINIGFVCCFALLAIVGIMLKKDSLGLLLIDFKKFTVVLSLSVALWLTFYLWSNQILYDHALYYCQQVFWAKAHAIIPGLANLYNRLGFYDSFFLNTALIDTVPFISGYRLSVSLLVFVLLFRCITALASVIKDSKHVGIKDIFFTLLLLPVFFKASTPLTVNVPVTDTVVYVLTIVVFGYFLEFLFAIDKAVLVLMVSMLSIAGIIVKGSFLLIGIWVMAVTIFLWITQKISIKSENKIVMWALIIAVFGGIVPFLIRNILVSGYWLYPFPYLSLPVEWQVPFPKVLSTFNWVLSWSRAPYQDWHNVLHNDAWVSGWLKNLTSHLISVVLPGFISLSLAILIVVRRFRGRMGSFFYKNACLFFMVLILGVVTWFFSAPDIRFLGAQLLVFAAGLGAILLSESGSNRVIWSVIGVGVSCFIMIRIILLLAIAFGSPYFKNEANFYKPLRFLLKSFKTDSGLVIYTPSKNDLCGETTLPCSPYTDHRLRLIKPGDIRSGFRV